MSRAFWALGALLVLLPSSGMLPRAAHAEGRREVVRDDRRVREEEEARRREEERRRWALEHPVQHEVIAPAPVIYTPPPPSPGISIVLPINFH